MDASHVPWLVAIAACAMGLGAVAAHAGARLWRRSRARRRMLRARRGERAARELLVSRGFDVLAEQAPGSVVLRVDGATSVHDVRADYLVSRGGRRFVAEVKTGTLAPSLEHAPTRRQLLEYASAFAIDGVLLVDPEAGRVAEVSFGGRTPARRWPIFASGLALGIIATGVASLVISAWLVR